MKKIFFFLLPVFFLQACHTTGLYEQTKTFTKQEWSSNDRPTFNFTIEDSLAYYNIYFVVRHSDAYHFNNIWLNYTMVPPGDTATANRIEIALADAHGWFGTAMDDIIEQRMLINKNPVHLKPGNYTFMLQQIMRENPLKGILSAGIRAEKIIQ